MTEGTGAPTPEDWFWDLIETSDRGLRVLAKRLEELPKERLQQYLLWYDEAKEHVNPAYIEEFWPHMPEPCSDDHGDDFAAWVVAQGREYLGLVRSNPADIQTHLDIFEADLPEFTWDTAVDREEYRGYQRPGSIVTPIYETRFGEDLLDACYEPSGMPRTER
jgi:hypothetical protein